MRSSPPRVPEQSAVTLALKDCRRAFWSIAAFSGVVNILMLAGPLYMLQVYDRVLGGRSLSTLLALSVILIGAYAFQGLLDGIRGRIVNRVATLLDSHLEANVHAAVLQISNRVQSSSDALTPIRDLDQIRAFLTSTGPLAIVDLPWIPLFLVICFLIHPWLGLLAVIGGGFLFTLALLTEWASRAPSAEMAQNAARRAAVIEGDRANSETALAMGMSAALAARWSKANQLYLGAISRASDVASVYGSISKVTRMTIQSAILGLGAYLVVRQEMTSGSMIACSVMVGRALAPVETAIANWRLFVSARTSTARLSKTLLGLDTEPPVTALPKPTHQFEVERLAVTPPGSGKPVIQGITFSLFAGEALGIIGPSGAGKTSVVRALAGIWSLAAGSIRLDGAEINQWDPQLLGRYLGFVSQTVELFDGTIAENIARMSSQRDDAAVIKAAQAAGAHDMILRIPSGYDARIGAAGAALSAGQRQRLALARALYNDPFLIILDEPNSNLDNEGDLALKKAIVDAKARRAIVIVIAHRPSALLACDKVLYVANGTQQAFGPRDDVLRNALGRGTAPVLPQAAGAHR